MSAVNGASIELARRRRVRQLQVALAAVTLLLATLVLWKATGPVFAKAQAPSTATVSGGVSADRNRNGELPQPRPARGRLMGAERRFGALAAPESP